MNKIKSAFKSFYNFKIYTSINLFGLILGLSCSAVIFLYVSFEFSFDNFHKDKERIFRVNEISTSSKNREISPSVRIPYGPALKAEISEIEDVVRIRNNWHVNTLKFNDKEIALENAIYADSNLFRFFSFKILSGKPDKLLASKNSIVLTQKIAKRIFGNKNPLGNPVEYNNNTYIVTGIAEDLPLNSHIRFDAVLPMETLLNSPDMVVDWDAGITAATFVKLYSPELETQAEEKLPGFLWDKINKENKDAGLVSEFYLEPLSRIHLFSEVDWDSNSKDGKYVMVLLFVGILILLTAVINYLFISNGTLTLRMKEFKIKNHFGLGESGIWKQIFTDSLILFTIAAIASLILVFAMEDSVTQTFKTDFLSFQLKKNLLLLPLAVILISSITSLIQFIIFKRKIADSPVINSYSPPFLNKKLVYISAFQFCISIGLIASMIIVYKQLNYALHKDLGFKTENVINISHGAIGAKQEVLINEITKLPGVANASAGIGVPGLETTMGEYQPEGSEHVQMFSTLYVDDNFFDTYELKLLEGKKFRKGINSQTKEYIVNETLAKEMNWESAVGKSMDKEAKHEIIGVVKDFHVGLIYSKIPPLVISKEWPEYFYSLSVALKPNETKQTIHKIENLWKKIIPETPFNYSYMDAKFETLYAEIKQTATILFLFTAISILISILGLFGITFLLMTGKVKEIGIRKVNGATVIEILKMLNYKFIKWVLIAFVIAVPISRLIMHEWLQSFAYKIEMSWWIFALAGLSALLTALITVSLHTFKAARRNPVNALRHE
jgi:putative ABC transport system permease protein